MEVFKKEVNGQTVNYQEITTETVVANPTAEGTEQLQKLQVGNTVYKAGMTTEESNKLVRALVTPVSAPSTTELVAVGTNGAQTMLEIGQGLRVSAGILEAEATASGNYVLELTGESGTLTDEQYQAVVDNFPNVTILQDGIMYDLVKTSLVETGIYRFVTQSIQNGNKIIELSYIINADKTWLFTTYEIAITSSSGGIDLASDTNLIYDAEVNISSKKLQYIHIHKNYEDNQTYLLTIERTGQKFSDSKIFTTPHLYLEPTLTLKFTDDTYTYEYIYIFKMKTTLEKIEYKKQYRRTIADNTLTENTSPGVITKIRIYKLS